MSAEVACVGVIVDAKPDAVEFYRRYGFLEIEVLQGTSDARPQPTPMFLSTRQIREAAGP
jgi:hypothetical protein